VFLVEIRFCGLRQLEFAGTACGCFAGVVKVWRKTVKV
jgi:hypothetical protein